ncbi:type IV secretory pathway VirB10-like protein [Bradyrhizobium sp. USDA 3311]
MTDTGQANDSANDAPRIKPAEENAQSLRLRPDRPQVVRLSRKVLAGGSALLLVLISGAVFWALQGKRSRNAAPEELYATDHHNVADQLANLPKDYAEIPKGVPRLGPPLPGDLGRPIVAAQGSSSSTSLGLDAEQQRVNQESEAARIRCDLPGQITAQVTEAVYDSPTGRARLIPQGARLIGTYDSQAAFGQSRLLLVWTRLIMPNGRSVVLER